MERLKTVLEKRFWLILMWGVMFLFFFQLISDFVEGIYVFGLLGTGIPVEIVSVLLLFSPLLLLILPKKSLSRLLPFLGGLVLVCRVLEPMLNTRWRMIVSGLGVAAFLLFFPLVLGRQRKEGERGLRDMGVGLLVSVLLSVFFRTVNSGWDISTYGNFQVIGWILALAAGYQVWNLFRADEGTESQTAPASKGKVIGYSLGIVSILLLLYFIFTSPNVVSRWTGVDHFEVLVFLFIGIGFLGVIWFFDIKSLKMIPKWALLLWNVIFVLALVFTILPHQITFPQDPGGYPLLEPIVKPLDLRRAMVMLLTAPVIFIDFVFFTRGLVKEKPSPRDLGLGFSIASLFTLLAIFGQVFSTVYDYIPVVGPFFRDKFWLVFLVLGIVMVLPTLLLREKKISMGMIGGKPGRYWLVLVVAMGLVTLISAELIAADPPKMPGDMNGFRILTYNVQQGYSEAGEKNLDGQVAYILSHDPDIVALQESDTNRIAGGNADLVGYFANKLNMYSYYGPKVVPGTFGIALLSKYPIQNPQTYYFYSEGEQTAAILADIVVGDRTIKVVVTHLGNGGPMIQQQQLLELIKDEMFVVAVGDYNFRPYEEQYALTTSIFADAVLLSPLGVQPMEFDESDRIDHVFITPNFRVQDALYLIEPESDHPGLYVDLSW